MGSGDMRLGCCRRNGCVGLWRCELGWEWGEVERCCVRPSSLERRVRECLDKTAFCEKPWRQPELGRDRLLERGGLGLRWGSGPEWVMGAEWSRRDPCAHTFIALVVAGRLYSPLQGGCERSGDVQKALAWE